MSSASSNFHFFPRYASAKLYGKESSSAFCVVAESCHFQQETETDVRITAAVLSHLTEKPTMPIHSRLDRNHRWRSIPTVVAAAAAAALLLLAPSVGHAFFVGETTRARSFGPPRGILRFTPSPSILLMAPRPPSSLPPGNDEVDPEYTPRPRSSVVDSDAATAGIDDNDNDNSGADTTNNNSSYLEVLALSVALFFVATVAVVGGDQLFATPSTTMPRVVIDADAVLREDFERSSSVLF